MIDGKRLHPLQILPFIGKNLFLFLLPIIRSLLLIRSPDALYAWLRGAWFDLLIVGVVFGLSFLEWRHNRFSCTQTHLQLRRGVWFRQETVIPLDVVTTLTVEAPWYLVPLRAKRVFIDTAAGRYRRMDVQLLLYTGDADALQAALAPKADADPPRYRSRWWQLFCVSLFVSGNLTGVLFLATVFNQTGKILGAEVQALLLHELETIAGLVDFIPRTAALAALILLIGWGLAFLRSLLHYIHFTVERQPARIGISTGIFVRRAYICPVAAVNYLDLRQTVLSRLARLYVVYIHCIGYGKRKYDKAVLLPAATKKTANAAVTALLRELPRAPLTVRPTAGALWRYTRPWLLAALPVFPAVETAVWLLPFWTDLFRFAGIAVLLPIFWRLLIAVTERRTAGIGANAVAYTLCYARGFALHTVVLPRDKVCAVRVRQSLWQRRGGCCDLLLYSSNERRTAHRIRHLSIEEVYRHFGI